MAEPVTFIVPGEPVGYQRAGRNGKRSFKPAKTAAYQNTIAWAAKAAGATMIEGPVRLSVCAFFAAPKSWTKARKQAAAALPPHCQTPDADNIAKSIADALQGVCYADDKAVSSFYCRKVWAPQSETVVTVEPLT